MSNENTLETKKPSDGAATPATPKPSAGQPSQDRGRAGGARSSGPGGRGPGPQRSSRGTGHVGQPAHHLAHLVEGRPFLIWTRHETLERTEDHAGVDPAHPVVAEAQPVDRARRVIFHEHVRGFDEALHDRLSPGALEVQDQTFLVSVEGWEKARSEPLDSPCFVSLRGRLDLDDLRPHIGQDQTRRRSHDRQRQFQNPNSGQGQRRSFMPHGFIVLL